MILQTNRVGLSWLRVLIYDLVILKSYFPKEVFQRPNNRAICKSIGIWGNFSEFQYLKFFEIMFLSTQSNHEHTIFLAFRNLFWDRTNFDLHCYTISPWHSTYWYSIFRINLFFLLDSKIIEIFHRKFQLLQVDLQLKLKKQISPNTN